MHLTRSVPRAKEEGSAFVISILVLFVLTVLGMALMLTTTTEKDIAINYRWGEQAFFNTSSSPGISPSGSRSIGSEFDIERRRTSSSTCFLQTTATSSTQPSPPTNRSPSNAFGTSLLGRGGQEKTFAEFRRRPSSRPEELHHPDHGRPGHMRVQYRQLSAGFRRSADLADLDASQSCRPHGHRGEP